MITDKHYSPAINVRLKALFLSLDYQALTAYLDGLSNSNFRTAGYMIGECYMPTLADVDFFACFEHLVGYNSRAFLGTLLKALLVRYGQSGSSLPLESAPLQRLLAQLSHNAVDTQKTLAALLPTLSHPDHISRLFALLGVDDAKLRVGYLVKVHTPASYFVLLHTLHYLEHEHAFLVRTAYYLQKVGTGMSYNMASLLKTLYGLDEVKGTFSLCLQPYELSRIEASYEAFVGIIKR